ncbi:MAG: glycosyl hydrolase family 28-related protein [Armatimonadota bacterium]|nr:glycosyl hydrolase family 28-related protein [Armatimonadota bacterium]
MEEQEFRLSRREALKDLGALAGVASLGLGSAQTVTVRPRSSPAVNVRDFGARGDGRTDDTIAFEKAIEAARSAGTVVFVPRAHYLLTRTLVLENVSLTGPAPGVWCADVDTLPILLPQHRQSPCLVLKAGGGLQAMAIRYDWQGEPDSGAPAVLVAGIGAYISQVKILYPWDGIMADGVSNIGRLNVENVFIVAPRNIGMRVTGTWDVPTVRNVEVWNLGPVPRPFEKGVGFDLGKNDMLRMSDCFVFAMHTGYLLREEIPGVVVEGGTWGTLTGCSSDFCHVGIEVRGEHTISVTGGCYWSHFWGVRVEGDRARVRLTGAEFKSNGAPCVEVLRAEQVVVDGCSLLRPMETFSAPAVHLRGGHTTLSGCHLFSATEGIRIDAGVSSALIAGNTLQAARPVVHTAPAGAAVEMWGNLHLRPR